MKKILLISHSSDEAGGAEDDFERMIKYLNSLNKYEIHGLFPEGPRAEMFSKYCARWGVYKWGIFPVVYENLFSYIKYLLKFFIQSFEILKFTRGTHYHLCITNVIVLLWPVLIMKFKNTKTLVLVKEKIEPKFVRYIYLFILRLFTDKFITNNNTLKDDIQNMFRNINVISIYPSVEESVNQEKKLHDVIGKKFYEYLVQKDKFKLLSVGGINVRKNQLLILQSIAHIRKQNPSLCLELYIVGNLDMEVDYARKVFEFYKQNKLENWCYFLGPMNRDTYMELYEYIDASVISSISEGLSLFLIESMMKKKPVVSTKVGGIPEIIVDKYNGLLVDLNKESLSDSILALVNDKNLYNKISVNAYNTFVENFNAESNYKSFDAQINDILNYR